MESNGDKYSIKKLSINQQGASLFAAILISLFALLALSSLYFALTKLLGTSQTIKTYASVRDATTAGVNHGVMLLQGKKITENEHCNSPITQRFRLSEGGPIFENKIYICYMAYQVSTGFEVVGVAYTKEIAGDIGNIYTIISEAEGPQNTSSRIEAVYAR
jgi:hypothetical protein